MKLPAIIVQYFIKKNILIPRLTPCVNDMPVIIVDFDVTNQLLIRYSAIIRN
jgi:hypothetical protein